MFAVSDLNKNFGGSTDLAPKRHGSADLHTPIHPPQAFSLKYSCRTSFLQYYQVLSAIPKHLLSIAKQPDTLNKSFFISNDDIFLLNDPVQINFCTARSRDFYKLLVSRTHTHDQTGPKRWSENLPINKDSWTSIFKSLKNVCKETRLKEFQFKLIHRIVITRKELFKLVSKPMTNACIVGIRTPLSTLLLIVRLLSPLQKKSYNGSMKLIVVKSPRPRRNSCSVLSRAPKKQS